MRGLRLVVLGVVIAAIAASAAAAPPRFNVVVIMADDLDVHSLETTVALGQMPAFRANFVDAGVRFTQSFVTNSLCCPSRATFLTGQYSHNHGALSKAGPYGASPASATTPPWRHGWTRPGITPATSASTSTATE